MKYDAGDAQRQRWTLGIIEKSNRATTFDKRSRIIFDRESNSNSRSLRVDGQPKQKTVRMYVDATKEPRGGGADEK